MTSLFVILFLISVPVFILSLIRPQLFQLLFVRKVTKGQVRWIFGLLIPTFLILIGASADTKKDQGESATFLNQEVEQITIQENNEDIKSIEDEISEIIPIVEIKEEKNIEEIDFEILSTDDPNLEKGTTKISQEGVSGTKELVYEVTYTNGKETNRKLISESILTQPVKRIIANGTKENKPIVTETPCGSDYYRNVDGNCVHRPDDNPSGATAKCRDGSYSYSQNRRGTCSHHGGVAKWL